MAEKKTQLEPLMVGIAEASRLLGIGRSAFYQYSSSGKLGVLPVVSFGRKKLYSVQELRNYVAAGCPAREQWQAIKDGAKK